MPVIKDIFGLAAVVPHKPRKTLLLPQIGTDPTLLYGVELEIERIRPENTVVTGISVTTDNSLRNNGMEYITRPMAMREMVYVLNNFFLANKFTEHNYSERTSVHVHANCQDLTPEQLAVLLLSYQVFERLLFQFVGGDRDKNIFCVPWYETNLNAGIVSTLVKKGPAALRGWQKYTALNLLPLFSQGTIEFRHLPGTCNLEKIYAWLNIIGCLFRYARVTPLEAVQKTLVGLNTTSEYLPITEAVFGEFLPMLLPNEEAFAALEEGVLTMKYSLIDNTPYDATEQLNLEQDLFNHIARQEAQARVMVGDGGLVADALRNLIQGERAPVNAVHEDPRP